MAPRRKRRVAPTIQADAARFVEERNEALAPKAQRVEVTALRDGEVVVLREALAEPAQWQCPDAMRPVTGYKRTDSLKNIASRSPDKISPEMVDAARRLAQIYETSQGCNVGAPQTDRVDSFTTDNTGPSDRMMNAVRSFNRACVAMGKLSSGTVLPVVLMNDTLQELSKRTGTNATTLLGYLASGLDRLVTHLGGAGPDEAQWRTTARKAG